MITIYKSIDGKEFTDKAICEKHENDLVKMKKIFEKLVDEDFFHNYKIKPFFHNSEITCLGRPSKNDWRDKYHGYRLVNGRYGNGDTIVSFKLRGDKLLIFRWDTDDSESDGKRYLGCINVNEPRRIKLEKIIKKIKEETI